MAQKLTAAQRRALKREAIGWDELSDEDFARPFEESPPVKVRVGRPPPKTLTVALDEPTLNRKIDSLKGRYIYSQRLGTVEPVFANICSTLGLRRFSLRGETKVDAQWKLFCIVHNLLKIHRYGPGFA